MLPLFAYYVYHDKSILRPLGILNYHLIGYIHSILLVAIPGCHNVAAVFLREDMNLPGWAFKTKITNAKSFKVKV